MPQSVELFISYSHKDELLRDALETHLSNLKWQGIVASWHDRRIQAGCEWDSEIKLHLDSADIILFLISPDFIASKYCRAIEIPQAMQRHEAGEAIVVPIILRPFDWKAAPFSKLQAFPKDAKPVTSWTNQDEAYLSISQGIRSVAEILADKRKQDRIQKEKAKDQYLKKVEEVFSREDVLSKGEISIGGRDTLDERRLALDLTPEEAEEIETHAFGPYKRYQENLDKYEQTLIKVIQDKYPLSDSTKETLEHRQHDLGLKSEDVERISQPILKAAEEKFQKATKAAEEAAEEKFQKATEEKFQVVPDVAPPKIPKPEPPPFIDHQHGSKPSPKGTPSITPDNSLSQLIKKYSKVLLPFVAAIGLLVFFLSVFKPSTPSDGVTDAPSDPSEITEPTVFENRFSSGERVLASEETPIFQAGTKEFTAQDYQGAIDLFLEVIEEDKTNPEPVIYLHNAKARQRGNPYVLAVVVPANSARNSAKEILRGVADAQTRFNENADSNNGRWIEIQIVNDGNDTEVAPLIAKHIVDDPTILGVIGHGSSKMTKAALPMYQEAGLPVITPTSTSTDLESNVFFRTVPSNAAIGLKLAEYAANDLGMKRAVVFFESDDTYSETLRNVFSERFSELLGAPSSDIIKDVDIRLSQPDVSTELQDFEADVSILIPGSQKRSEAPRIIKEIANYNSTVPTDQRVVVIGGDILYTPKILIEGGTAVEGLVVVVPIIPTGSYAEAAMEQWQGSVNWRTAAAFDATQAFAATLLGDLERDDILQTLRSVTLSAEETSGDPLQFDSDGERSGEPLLVTTSRDVPKPENAVLGFEQLQR